MRMSSKWVVSILCWLVVNLEWVYIYYDFYDVHGFRHPYIRLDRTRKAERQLQGYAANSIDFQTND